MGKYSKQRKSLFIGTLVLVVLLLVYLLLQSSVREAEEGDAAAFLTDMTAADIGAFSIEKADGTAVSFAREDDRWVMNGEPDTEIDQTKAGTAAASLTGVTLLQTIDVPEALEEYGLLEPQYRVTVAEKDGIQTEIAVGNSNETAGVVYVLLNGDEGTVYAVSPSILSNLAYGTLDYLPEDDSPGDAEDTGEAAAAEKETEGVAEAGEQS